MPPMGEPRNSIGFYGRIIDCFNRLHPDPLYLNEVSRLLDRPGAMLHRYLKELVARGVLEQVPPPVGSVVRRRGGHDRTFYRLTAVGRRMRGLVHVPRFVYLDGPQPLELSRATVQTLRLLHLVAPRPLTRPGIAHVLGLSDGSVRDVLYRLEYAVVVERPSPGAVPVLLALTEAGEGLAAECSTPGIPLATFPQPLRRGT